MWASRKGGLQPQLHQWWSASQSGEDLFRDLINPSKCTVAASFCALSFLPASLLGSHFIQIMSLKFFPQCSLISCGSLSLVDDNYLVLKSFVYQSTYFNVCLCIYLFTLVDRQQIPEREEINSIMLFLGPQCNFPHFFSQTL